MYPADSFGHLATSSLPGGKGIMAFITALFDDSGTHPESSIAVAACVLASGEQWRRFNREWVRAERKEKFGVFHMADFAAGHHQFKGWDRATKNRVLRRLCGILLAHARKGWAIAVRKKDYDSIIEGPFREYAGRFHYTFCVRQCASRIGVWRRERKKEWSLRYAFDRMSQGKGEIMNAMDRADGLDGYGFEDKSKILPLQAADIFAWTALQQMHGLLSKRKTSEIANTAFELLSTGGLFFGYFTEPNLREWADAESAELVKRLLERSGPVTGA